MGVKCVEVEGARDSDPVPKFNARSVRHAIMDILAGSVQEVSGYP